MILNAVAPGVMKTPVLAPETHEFLAELHPVGRMREIQDIIDAILFLENAAIITGETAIHVSYVARPRTVPISGTEAAGQRPFECAQMALCVTHQTWTVWRMAIRSSAYQWEYHGNRAESRCHHRCLAGLRRGACEGV